MQKDLTRRPAAIHIVVAATIAGVVIAAHTLPAAGGDAFLQRAVFDVVHVLGFAVIAASSSVAARRLASSNGISQAKVLSVVAAVLLGLALLAESLQHFTARDASYGDLLRDGFGIAAGMLAGACLPQRGGRRWALLGVCAVLLAASVHRPAATVLTVAIARLGPDGAVRLANRSGLRVMEPRNAAVEIVAAPTGWTGDGPVLRVVPAASGDAGFTYYGLPRDWSRYRRLRFTIATEHAAPSELTLRVEGPLIGPSRRDRSRIRIDVTTTPRSVSMSLHDIAASSRHGVLRLDDVHGFSVLARDARGSAFYVSDLRLE